MSKPERTYADVVRESVTDPVIVASLPCKHEETYAATNGRRVCYSCEVLLSATKSNKRRRAHLLSVWVTAEEKEEIQARADERLMTISDYVRNRLAGMQL